jgi:hypothetical protein
MRPTILIGSLRGIVREAWIEHSGKTSQGSPFPALAGKLRRLSQWIADRKFCN